MHKEEAIVKITMFLRRGVVARRVDIRRCKAIAEKKRAKLAALAAQIEAKKKAQPAFKSLFGIDLKNNNGQGQEEVNGRGPAKRPRLGAPAGMGRGPSAIGKGRRKEG